jgi:hypothetical protein
MEGNERIRNEIYEEKGIEWKGQINGKEKAERNKCKEKEQRKIRKTKEMERDDKRKAKEMN